MSRTAQLPRQPQERETATEQIEKVAETPQEPAQVAAKPKYNDDTVAVWVWTPGFNHDTGEVLNKPYVYTTNRLDWEHAMRKLGDNPKETTTLLEHIGLAVVGIVHLPNGCTEPNINAKEAAKLKSLGLI